MSSPVYVSDWQALAVSMGNRLAYRTLDFTATGLNPATRYYYRIEGQNAAGFDTVSRSVKTAPNGAAAFKFVLGSCSHLDQPRGLNKSIIHYTIAGYVRPSRRPALPQSGRTAPQSAA
jgi:phosphodiesterase/alkaline phosphatase D-like protein